MSRRKKVFDLIAYTPVFDDKLNLIKLNFHRKTNFLNRRRKIYRRLLTLEGRRSPQLNRHFIIIFISFRPNDINGDMLSKVTGTVSKWSQRSNQTVCLALSGVYWCLLVFTKYCFKSKALDSLVDVPSAVDMLCSSWHLLAGLAIHGVLLAKSAV